MEHELARELKPLYKAMLDNISSNKELYSFCMQWGKNFPLKSNEGILVVGKATNGWITNSREIEVLFGESANKVFARDDQMKWVSNLATNKKGYNTRKSPFWRVIKRVAKKYYQNTDEEWSSLLAWSNLYKISYDSGNPCKLLKKAQEQYCKKILKTEIQILAPRYVIFFTSGWENSFFEDISKGKTIKEEKSTKWSDKKYEVKSYLIENVIYIISVHPQGKLENNHTNAISKIIERWENKNYNN
ncbi:hypothetical protein [Labilibaculum euxinus]